MSDSEELIDPLDESGDDLFGDNDVDQLSDQERAASDHGLGLDSDQEDEERYGDEDGRRSQPETKTKLVMGVHMFRHRTPKSKDGNLTSLRVPNFLKWNPQEYKADTYEPSKFDLENSLEKNPRPVVRFRKDPETGELQSNAVIYKWSDGSVTLAVGDEQYEIQTKSLAPPSDKPYQELQDAHYYAAAAQLSSNSLLIVGHVTEQYTIRPNKEIQDDALKRLTDRLAEASRSSEGDMIIRTTQDPELQKKQAELAEKERERARRRRENAAARMDGARGYNRGALSIGDLEGRRAPGAGRKRGAPGAPRQKRRRPEYDSDDDLPQGARRQDDYDMADDFIAPSDEEVSEGVDDEEEEDLLDDDDEDEAPRTKRQKTAEAEDEDAEADMDDDVGPSAHDSSRRNRRHIIDDDEDED